MAVESEKAWLHFRDAEDNAVQIMLLARRGYLPQTRSAIDAWQLSLVKERVAVLKEYDAFLNRKTGLLPDHTRDRDTRIDRWLYEALAGAVGEQEMANAIEKAARMWDRELNRIYHKIVRECRLAERRGLVAAEKAWLSFRDLDGKTIEKTIFDHGNPELADANWFAARREQIYLIKLRVLQLGRFDAMINPPPIPGHKKAGNSLW